MCLNGGDQDRSSPRTSARGCAQPRGLFIADVTIMSVFDLGEEFEPPIQGLVLFYMDPEVVRISALGDHLPYHVRAWWTKLHHGPSTH
jgi:hypothetical protein